MKSILVGLAIFGIPAASLPQGTVIFNNQIPGTLVTHVYVAGQFTGAVAGNGPNDTPPGTTDYSDAALLSGSRWSVQIWAAPGDNQPESSLRPASPITTFLTGSQAGFFAPSIATLAGVPPDAPVATLVVRVWDNIGGTITSWDVAQGVSLSGESPLFNVTGIGGVRNAAPPLVGLQSFSIVEIPEPSTLAILSMASVFLISVTRQIGLRNWREDY
jgi:hypothetical protein